MTRSTVRFSQTELRKSATAGDSWEKGGVPLEKSKNGSNCLFYTTQESVTPAPESVTSKPASVTKATESVTNSVESVTKICRAVTKGDKGSIIPNVFNDAVLSNAFQWLSLALIGNFEVVTNQTEVVPNRP